MFESDKVKYFSYQLAIQKALEAKKSQKDSIQLAVVGAGRGPIVDCAIRAGAKHIFVIEKNPNAFKLLQLRKEKEWPSTVEIFLGDMRTIQLPREVDILVSELLGGFGDNELSPECIEGCERFLSSDSISIPQKYTSYIVPLMSQNLWCKSFHEGKLQQMLVTPLKTSILLSSPQPFLEFSHPGHNEKYKKKEFSFTIAATGELSGFGGWFETVLFDDVILSTSPYNGTQNLESWLPVYFPINRQINVTEGEVLKAIFARRTDNKKVWYEWAVMSPKILPMQNGGGSFFSFDIGLE
ncbi:protein arginine N-methyltransferase 5-like [Histomonas meleagridis]|uniref:protein arginine N-methyltransferase 5-like n=1 Tax=Histomonas meleagridis TaxID=135588 RepID=UPI00355970BE|nr:protein arginine N-methyltransferase 5-like [Histomonas meleagridis]KAH0796981.1 protein arginine N-methyltransferase 5-like [Histomonas meleagridis]